MTPGAVRVSASAGGRIWKKKDLSRDFETAQAVQPAEDEILEVPDDNEDGNIFDENKDGPGMMRRSQPEGPTQIIEAEVVTQVITADVQYDDSKAITNVHRVTLWSTHKRMIGVWAVLLLLAAVGVILGVFLGAPSNEDALDQGGLFFDPFVGQSFEKRKWPSEKQGITIPVMNAMGDEWQDDVTTVMSMWNESNSVNLNVTRFDEPELRTCPFVGQSIKLCSGDFGEIEEWFSRLSIINAGDTIVAATIVLNDWYHFEKYNATVDEMEAFKEDRRIYRICHQFGHSLGLAHTDENYTNPNLGDCMDMTLDYTSNAVPGQVNFNFLEEYYGVFPAEATGSRRLAEHDAVLDRAERALQDPRGWKLVHESPDETHHERSLGGLYKLSVNKRLRG